jgi:hypothetical protein
MYGDTHAAVLQHPAAAGMRMPENRDGSAILNRSEMSTKTSKIRSGRGQDLRESGLGGRLPDVATPAPPLRRGR